jgi:hypothetical protein
MGIPRESEIGAGGISGHNGVESGHGIADVRFSADYVRYWGYSGHKIQGGKCPLLTQSGNTRRGDVIAFVKLLRSYHDRTAEYRLAGYRP